MGGQHVISNVLTIYAENNPTFQANYTWKIADQDFDKALTKL